MKVITKIYWQTGLQVSRNKCAYSPAQTVVASIHIPKEIEKTLFHNTSNKILFLNIYQSRQHQSVPKGTQMWPLLGHLQTKIKETHYQKTVAPISKTKEMLLWTARSSHYTAPYFDQWGMGIQCTRVDMISVKNTTIILKRPSHILGGRLRKVPHKARQSAQVSTLRCNQAKSELM